MDINKDVYYKPLKYNLKINTSEIKNVILIDSTVTEAEMFFNSVNSSTFPIIYSYNSNKEELLQLLTDKFKNISRLGFVMHNASFPYKKFLNDEYFFNETDLEDQTKLTKSPNFTFIIDLIKKFNIINLDNLACKSLLDEKWKKYYGLLNLETGVIIGASDNYTGNIKYGGDWILESSGENIQNIYWTSKVLDYSSKLASTQLSFNAGNIYLRQTNSSASVDYSTDNTTWISIGTNWPLEITNTSTDSSVLTVSITTNIIANATTVGSLANFYIKTCSSNITIEGNNNGNLAVITINELPTLTNGLYTTNFIGLVSNGNGTNADGFTNITVQKIGVITDTGDSTKLLTLPAGQGWICQSNFAVRNGNEIFNCFVNNCYSTGQIGTNGGGITGGRSSGTINSCYSTGKINESAGGIFGVNALNNARAINCYSTGISSNSSGGIFGGGSHGIAEYCYSTGDMGSNAGGIFGSLAGNDYYTYTGGAIALNCYSTGSIAPNAGGIFGKNSIGLAINCYSQGKIGSPVASNTGNSGGIFGASSSGSAINCYSSGNIDSGSGGIFGINPGFVKIINCYVSGKLVNNDGSSDGTFKGSLIGYAGYSWDTFYSERYSPYQIINSYAENLTNITNNTWSDVHASQYLISTIGSSWVSTQQNLPYTLFKPTETRTLTGFSFTTSQSYSPTPFTPTLPTISTGEGTGTISYFSTNLSVATVDNLTGIVTKQNFGSSGIVAILHEDSTYQPYITYLTLNVTRATNIPSELTIQPQTYGPGVTFIIENPISNSTGEWTYTSSNILVATITKDNDTKISTVSIIGAGTTTISARQSETSKYLASNLITTTLVINKATPSVSLSIPNNMYGDPNFNITNPLSISQGEWTYTSSNDDVVTITKDNTTKISTVSIIGAGTITITATQSETANYNSVTITTPFTVKKFKITDLASLGNFTIENKIKTDFVFPLPILTKPAGHPGTWSYISSKTNIATISGTNIEIVGETGIVTITATLSGDNNYEEIKLYTKFSVSDTTPSNFQFVSKTQVVSLLSGLTLTGSIINLTSINPNVYSTFNPTTGTQDEKMENRNLVVQSIFETFYESQRILVPKQLIYLPALIELNSSLLLLINSSNSDSVNPFIVQSTDITGSRAVFINTPNTGNSVEFNRTDNLINYNLNITKNELNYDVIKTINSISEPIENKNKGDIIQFGGFYIVLGSITGLLLKIMPTITATPITKTFGDSTFIPDNITSTSSGQLTFSISGTSNVASITNNVVTITGAGSVDITCTQAETVDYLAGVTTFTLVINKATPSVSLTIPNNMYGNPNFNITNPSLISQGEWTYTSSNTDVVTITKDNNTKISTVSIIGAGTTTITATQAETANYNSVTTTASLVINKATPSVSLSIPNNMYGNPNFDITNPLSISQGEWTYTSSNTDVVTITKNNKISTVSIIGAGTTTITATQAETANYNSVTITTPFTVNKFKITDLASLGNFIIRNQINTTTTISLPILTKPAGHPGTWSYLSSNPSIATISEPNVILSGSSGAVTITAILSGDSNHEITKLTTTFSVSNTPSDFSFTSKDQVISQLPNINLTGSSIDLTTISSSTFATFNPSTGTDLEKSENRNLVVQSLFETFSGSQKIEVPKDMIYLSPEFEQLITSTITLINSADSDSSNPIDVPATDISASSAVFINTPNIGNSVSFNGNGIYQGYNLKITKLATNYEVTKIINTDLVSIETKVKGDIIQFGGFYILLGSITATLYTPITIRSGGDPIIQPVFGPKYALASHIKYVNLLADYDNKIFINAYIDFLNINDFPKKIYWDTSFTDIKSVSHIYSNSYYRNFQISYNSELIEIDADTLEINQLTQLSKIKIGKFIPKMGLNSISFNKIYPQTNLTKALRIGFADYILTLVTDLNTDDRHSVELIKFKKYDLSNISGALISKDQIIKISNLNGLELYNFDSSPFNKNVKLYN